MFDPALQQSPLTKIWARERRGGGSAEPGVCLAEKLREYLNLQVARHQLLVEQIGGLLGLSLPTKPNTFTENSHTAALWLGPDEWLLAISPSGDGAITKCLRQAGRGYFFALTDVSHGHTTVNLSGPRAADVLSKGCSIDLHPSVFHSDSCAQTLLAKVAVVICRAKGPESFDVIIRRSFAEYIVSWLQDAGLEYGVKLL